ncbi:MAG: carbon-nitrogen hydrolase family protein [Gemmatimonadaceae bacterium]|nr:carbon-nitrogen hydrolase family protein [Gemmatimonadaceae bacterium]
MTTIAAVQMVSTADVTENLATATRLVSHAAAAGATFVSLPEYFCLIDRDADRLRIGERAGDGPIQQRLADIARHHKIWLLGGTVPIRTDSSTHVRNASCLFAPDGSLAARYDKIHLFAFDNGREGYDEGAVLEAGDTPVVADVAGLRVGLSVCYDLRFPELYRQMTFADAASPLDLICAPSAFTFATGSTHWELLLRARAVENQCYVMAAAQGGVHVTGNRTWGHSMIVDPWGDVLACLDEGEGVVLATIDPVRIAAVRSQLPALAHRKLQGSVVPQA